MIDPLFKNHIEHVEAHMPAIKAASLVRAVYRNRLANEPGMQEFLTPVIYPWDMREYSFPLSTVTAANGKNLGFWQASPEYYKQMLALTCGPDQGYWQIAPSIRPSDADRTHLPYLHQCDWERCFDATKMSPDEAMEKNIQLMSEMLTTVFEKNGVKYSINRITYDEAMQKYQTDSPWIEPDEEDAVNITVLTHMPWFKTRQDGSQGTHILPMADPILTEDQTQRFIAGTLSAEEIAQIRVRGYDFIVSSKAMRFQRQDGIIEGMEVAGGSIRIANPDLQREVIHRVRPPEAWEGMEPIVGLLQHYQNTGRRTGGGALGTERMTMAVTGENNIRNVVAIPFTLEV